MRMLKISLIIIVILASLVMRFSALGECPDLEHDESLICSGARSIYQAQHFPLTGDKVYEGPLLEYLLAAWMFFAGQSLTALRLFMAFMGILSVFLIYHVAMAAKDRTMAWSAVCLILISPWHMSASRVLYACNLSIVFIPCTLLFLFKFLNNSKTRYLALAGLSLGLTANGRFTAYFLLPVILVYLFRKAKLRQLLWFTISALIPSLPVILYNTMHQWPATRILLGSGQGHFSTSLVSIPTRITAFSYSLFLVLTGERFWVDVQMDELITRVVILSCIALLIVLNTRARSIRAGRITPVPWFLVILLFLLPVVTKPLSAEQGLQGYHPHYFDMVFPLLALTIAWLYSRATKASESGTLILAVIYVVTMMLHLGSIVTPGIRNNDWPGRWHNQFKETADMIASDFPAQGTAVIVPWNFGQGFPQISWYLPDYTVIPTLTRYRGYLNGYSVGDFTKVAFVAPGKMGFQSPWEFKGVQKEGNDGYWFLEPGGYRIEGQLRFADGGTWTLRSSETQAGKLTAERVREGSLELPKLWDINDHNVITGQLEQIVTAAQNSSPRHKRLYERIASIVTAYEFIAVDSSGDNWQFLVSENSQSSGGRPVLIKVNDQGHQGVFRGTWFCY